MRQRDIEENLWRAIRHGMDGRMIDFAAEEEISTREAVERLVEWTAPARAALGLDVTIPEQNGAQRARADFLEGRSLADIYRDSLAETRRTYVPERVIG
jgi:carboxylate-amine ligase